MPEAAFLSLIELTTTKVVHAVTETGFAHVVDHIVESAVFAVTVAALWLAFILLNDGLSIGES